MTPIASYQGHNQLILSGGGNVRLASTWLRACYSRSLALLL